MNIGVRLGTPSKLKDGTYLAVIDCDVKGIDAKHLKEMHKKLAELFPDLKMGKNLVLSGRGGGSKHLYIKTKVPVTGDRLAQSKSKIKLHMPSVKPSQREIESMTPAELARGMRLRSAWEISLMGEGRQVVLPPSTHPDTLKPYSWGSTVLQDHTEIPLVDIAVKGERLEKTTLGGFKPTIVDLLGSSLSDRTVEMIETGKDVEDRSASLFSVSLAMVRAGFTDIEIMTVLTDRDNFLGDVAYEHAKTDSRQKAAQWILNYTLKKARSESSAAAQFAEDVEELPELSDEEAEEQLQSIKKGTDFTHKIERTQNADGRPKNTLKNVRVILGGEFGEKIFLKNDFSNRRVNGMTLPWGGKKGADITDESVIRIKNWLSNKYRFEPSTNLIWEAIVSMSAENAFHPLRDYVRGLPPWDGVPRVDTWLKTYLKAEAPELYLRAISRKVLVAMIARIFEPGCKFDYALVLEGPKQGEGKSRAVEALAGGEEYAGRINLKTQRQDLVLLLQAKWVVEISELAGMQKAEIESVKAFISEKVDQVRVPYGKLPEHFSRQCIFIGTTNNSDYLRDMTGNRRFWPVRVSTFCDVEGLTRNRDQLLAEARVYYDLGEPLWLENPEIDIEAREVQRERIEHDAWSDQIHDALIDAASGVSNWDIDPEKGFLMRDLFSDEGPLQGEKMTQVDQRRAHHCLVGLGYTYHVFRTKEDKKKIVKRWVKK